MKSSPCFTVEIKEKIAHIIMSRPEKRNSMIPAFWTDLPKIVEDIDLNSRARVIVISSQGPHFTSGLDVNAFFGSSATEHLQGQNKESRIARGASFYQQTKAMQHTFSCLEQCRIPVIAAIQGGCIGGGVDMATACDMRYGTEDSFFCIQETQIGMTADVGTFPRLCKLIPEGIVREMSYTARRVHATECAQLGLLNKVYKDQQSMLTAVMEIAADIANKAPLAISGCKRMINYSRDHSIEDTLDYVRVWNASYLQPEEMMEAMTAAKEQRQPNFVELPSYKPLSD